MIYRVLMAVLFTVIVIVFGVTTRDTLGLKFFIYMTNQGFMLLTLNYIFHASLVFIRWGWEINNKDKVYHQKCRINIFYKLSWILSTCSFDVALFITLVFWVALFPYVAGTLDTWGLVLNFLIHGFNSISCLIDMFIVKRDLKFWHLWFALAYGISYMIFSIVYWAVGGTDPNGNPYIYPILDWDGNPGLAVGTFFAGLVLLPLIHLFWMGATKLRIMMYRCIFRNQLSDLKQENP